ncbi:MAG: GGDEF domain-containing protein [Rhizobacter sp.]|nr:GGDEF domain-containing protein [Chlorobiales bacterium]
MITTLIAYLNSLPRPAAFTLAIYAVALLGIADYFTVYEIGVVGFYLLPVLLIAWKNGRRDGFMIATLSLLLHLVINLFARRDLQPLMIFAIEFAVRITIFCALVAATAFVKMLLDRERQRARRDFLTGLANRQAFDEAATVEIARSRRHRHVMTLVSIDCDHFKEVNDTLGHDAGDEVLRTVASVLQQRLRLTDLPARLGGDEFALLLPETNAEAAREVLEKLRHRLLAAMRLKKCPVTFSIGVATFTEPPDSISRAMAITDKILYRVKYDGKNAIAYDVINAKTDAETSGTTDKQPATASKK